MKYIPKRIEDGNRGDGRLAWYRWYPGDWLAETQGWPFEARGVYRELLDAQWNVGTLPAEPEKLRDLIHASRPIWRIAWPVIEKKFPRSNGGRLNPKLELQREDSLERRARHQAGAAATNARRWGRSESDSHSESASESPSESPSASPPAPAPEEEESTRKKRGRGRGAEVDPDVVPVAVSEGGSRTKAR